MYRDPHIPLFLWVAAALVVHAIGGGGAHEAAEVLGEKLDIRDFARLVSRQARLGTKPVEISLAEEQKKKVPETLETGHDDAKTEASETAVQPDSETEERKKRKAPRPEKSEKKPRPKKKKKEKDPPPEEQDTKQKPLQMKLDDRRVAVVQNVEDQNQKDNPDARFAAEHANHVEEETRARITSTDSNQARPSPSTTHSNSDPQPGNADERRIAQSEERPGPKNQGLGDAGQTESSKRGASGPSSRPARQQPARPSTRGRVAGSRAQTAQESSRARQGEPRTLSSESGRFRMAKPQEARRAQQGQKALLGTRPSSPEELLGYGSQAVTERGVNLNLSHASAQAMIGSDELAQMRKRAGQKRLSRHRGSWQNLGIDKWRPALENYVASVKPGNQTALNTARVPFSRYLNQIHQQLHQVFAEGFLASLESLPADHPLSNQEMSTHLEIALSPEDGRIVKMGITKTSGVTMFDVGALESVKKAAPYGTPPGSIVSGDGNVYLHWEFHRKRIYACSTYFARPFILDVDQKPAPPRVEPPPRKDYDERPADERSGSNEKHDNATAHPG